MDKSIRRNNISGSMLLTLYLALKPLYVLPSGSLQIADVLLMFGAAAVLLSNRRAIAYMVREPKRAICLFAALCLYQGVVNAIWSHVLGGGLLKPVLYYGFNLLAFATVLLVGIAEGSPKLRRAILRGALASIGVVYLGFVWQLVFRLNLGLSYDFYRDPLGAGFFVSFFNNPNQLGFHCLVLLTIVLYCSELCKRYVTAVASLACVAAVFLSNSRAAIVGAMVLILAYLLYSLAVSKTIELVPAVGAAAVMALVVWLLLFAPIDALESNGFVASLRGRLTAAIQNGELAIGERRGYNRVFEMGHNILWGMGEGHFERFSTLRGLETHSTYASLLVSYGLLGLAGYAVLFAMCVKSNEGAAYNCMILSGVLLYQVAHNGIRNTILWMMLAVMLCPLQEELRSQHRA